jgi:hypothetical protein
MIPTQSQPHLARAAVRVRNSLSYRSGPGYKKLLQLLPKPRLKRKDALEIPLVTMCGQNHLLMFEQTLFTIGVHWNLMPNVVVVSDGSLTLSRIQQQLSWWPRRVDVVNWQASRDFHKQKGRLELARYADKDVFGRKLSVILAMAEIGKVLWCDCDILFFSDFSKFIDVRSHGGLILQTAEDEIYAYDERLTQGTLKHLYSHRPVNSGIVLCAGDLYGASDLRKIIEQAASQPMYLTEQTVLAEAVCQIGTIAWGLDQVRLFHDDRFTLKPTYLGKKWIARHYVAAIRHLFWRDALASRLGMQ